MKLIVLFHAAVIILICSCGLLEKDEVKDFIPGVYIRFSQHEFGTEHDTLVITLQNSSANEYKITRKWKYERVVDGSAIEPEYKRLITSGIYDTKQKLLQETETGDMYSFDIKKNKLFIGPTAYQKIK